MERKMTYQRNTTDLHDDLANAIAVAREKFARKAGSDLAKTAGVGEDMVWRVRDDITGNAATLEGQVMSGYEASTVRGIVKAFADVLGSDVTDWEATADLSGVEASAPFAGLKVIVWGVA